MDPKTETTTTERPSIARLASQLMKEAEAQGVVVRLELRPRESGRWGMVMNIQPKADADARAAEAMLDSQLIDWLEVQCRMGVDLRAWCAPGRGEFHQLTQDDETIGEGATLRAAIKDAMGVRT